MLSSKPAVICEEDEAAIVHTVIIALTQGGVFRFVPFAVNASVGDAVTFLWNAKDHTVTKVSALEICSKASDASFAAVERNAPFMFTQVVNDTDPMFFYSGTPSNCEKGIPPGMRSAVSNSSDMAAMAAYANTQTSGNHKAASANWGQNIDLAPLPDWSHALVMYTRSFLRANPGTLKVDGSKGAAPRKSNGGAVPTAASSVLLGAAVIAAPSSRSEYTPKLARSFPSRPETDPHD
ncbi:hypothetical protein GSI_04550 [Ganoderma sinense ZZ0214-1]|uniref:Phytocyanin domain-containing protein n=1 Tax=Ganoderma sinense ZZ0214-1 TaxID=1077348 RepID=A0A2G8SH77_9APHY|nr:hypothetical protein GSI_04550 [Ganoderma sinense ZZ0214-1]